MSKWPDNKNKHWSSQEVKDLKQMARENTPTRVMGLKLGRTPDAVQSKASDLGVSLKPTNQRPYNTASNYLSEFQEERRATETRAMERRAAKRAPPAPRDTVGWVPHPTSPKLECKEDDPTYCRTR